MLRALWVGFSMLNFMQMAERFISRYFEHGHKIMD